MARGAAATLIDRMGDGHFARWPWLVVAPDQNGNQLLHFVTLLRGVAAGDRTLDTMGDVVVQHLVLDPAQGRTDRTQLGQHVDAIPVLVDHARDTAHLTLDPLQTAAAGLLDLVTHVLDTIPPYGICKPRVLVRERYRIMRLHMAISLAVALAVGGAVGMGRAQDLGGMTGMQPGHDMGGSSSAAGPAVDANRAAMQQMMQGMAMPATGDPDVDFAQGMIPHHQGAIAMAKIELQYGKDPQLRQLAQDIIAAQEAEIAVLQAWLAKAGR